MEAPRRSRAILMLVLTTAAWGLSFPGGKALLTTANAALPGRDPWFFSSLMIAIRFGLGAARASARLGADARARVAAGRRPRLLWRMRHALSGGWPSSFGTKRRLREVRFRPRELLSDPQCAIPESS